MAYRNHDEEIAAMRAERDAPPDTREADMEAEAFAEMECEACEAPLKGDDLFCRHCEIRNEAEKPKHTPGPWVVCAVEPGGVRSERGRDKNGGLIYVGRVHNPADAPLVAAAPEMFRLLAVFRDAFALNGDGIFAGDAPSVRALLQNIERGAE